MSGGKRKCCRARDYTLSMRISLLRFGTTVLNVAGETKRRKQEQKSGRKLLCNFVEYLLQSYSVIIGGH